MKQVSIVGVPEHFNYPWQMALNEEAFLERGLEVSWTDIPEGTGKMCRMLQEGKTDLAIVLTEGIVKSISDGNPSKIVQKYIGSPLQWGVHVGANSRFKTIEDLRNTKAAISRYGSGSHLMAYVNAETQGWDTEHLDFKIVDTLEGAVIQLTNGEADYFIWEHFTTKPYVHEGIFRRLGDCPTPWPCFVITATNSFLGHHSEILHHILEIINVYTLEFKQIPSIDRTLSNHYNLKLGDIRQWLGMTRWSQDDISMQTIDKVQDTLIDLKLIKNRLAFRDIVFKNS